MFQLTRVKKNLKKIISNKNFVILLLIIVIALVIRYFFFTGLIITLPQDDGIYHKLAYQTSQGNIALSIFNDLPADYRADPSDSFPFRMLSYLPTAFFYSTLGVSEFTTALFSLLCSIGSIILIYYFGKEFFDEKTGFIAAFLLAIFPLDIISSTRLSADVPLMFFMALSVFLFLRGVKYDGKKQIFLSGVILGLGYLIKVTGVLLIGIFIIFIIYLIFKKKFKYYYLLFLPGFLLVYVIEGLVMLYFCGDFFIRNYIVSNAWFVKYALPGENPELENKMIQLGPLKIIYDAKTEFQHILTLFGMWKPSPKREMVEFFGYFYYFIFPAIALFFYKNLREKNIRKYFQYFLIIWIFILLLYLDFGFLKIDSAGGFLRYFMLFKAPRFLAIIIIPSLLILAWAINPNTLSAALKKIYLLILRIFPNLKQVISKYISKKNCKRLATTCISLITISCLLFLSISSLYVTNQTHRYLMQSVTDLKAANDVIQEYPNIPVYADRDLVEMLTYYNSYERENIYFFDGKNTLPSGSIVILGGMKSIDLDPETIVRDAPEKLRPIIVNETFPENWVLIKKITEDEFGIRLYNMTIFYLIDDYSLR